MDIDSGNFSAVARVTSQERGKQHDAIVDLEKRQDDGTSEHRRQSEIPESSDGKEEDELPFSKTRSIFFVLALTGAAFLNARIFSETFLFQIYADSKHTDPRCPSCRYHPTIYRTVPRRSQ